MGWVRRMANELSEFAFRFILGLSKHPEAASQGNKFKEDCLSADFGFRLFFGTA